MSDILKYRFPNEKKRKKEGDFLPLERMEDFEGFIVKAFVGETYFGFQESNDSRKSYFNSEIKPTCYSKNEYLDLANQYLEQFRKNRVSKAILSRVKKVNFPLNPEIYYDALCEKYPNAFVYLISSKEFGTWIGATPEVLVSIEDGIGKTMALAGTRPANDLIEWTDKERDEQQYVTDYIDSKLNGLAIETIKSIGPKTLVSGPVEHLLTDFEFEMKATSLVELIETLHPTPAVCGLPLRESFEIINKIERHDRGLYTGLIGWIGAETILYVNLRCAQIIDSECYLYVGGGLTIDSNPGNEWVETENKAKTLLNVMENL
ncbi:chorismate-binding protein [Crocinitomicaceae bacterium]|nr:chorismate-binding protein [Crocinitomicaceae bacterium]MDC0098910.1 chorismate-binding protein [Crocinitomicaceae bacterium]MDC1283009.1 chorismate-binding protein [Crocinitomicaceae bacterium]